MEKLTAHKTELWAMSNFSKKTTGIDSVVFWINPDESGVHAPRVKVSNVKGTARFDDRDCFSVSLGTTPDIVAGISTLPKKDLKNVLEFVSSNHAGLIGVFNSQILMEDFMETSTKVNS